MLVRIFDVILIVSTILILDHCYAQTPNAEDEAAIKAFDLQFQSRIDAVSDNNFKLGMAKCGINSTNVAKLKANIFSSKDVSSLECIESKQDEIQADLLAQQQAKDHQDKILFGQKLVFEYTLSNSQKDLTLEQRVDLAEALGPISLLLNSGSLQAAKLAIQNLQVSEVFSQQQKDAFIAKIESFQLE